MTPEQRAIETMVLHQNLVDYWHDVDVNGGKAVASMYLEDGVFHAGPGKPLVGREAIAQFYGWRVDRGARTSRHVVTNFRAEFATSGTRPLITSCCSMPPTASRSCRAHRPFSSATHRPLRQRRGRHLALCRAHFTPLFMGGVAPTVPPESIAETHNAKGQA